MNTIKSSLLLTALILTSSHAMAQWSGAMSYSDLSDDDLSLGTINLHGAYEFKTRNSAFSYMPEIRLGIGIKDESVNNLNVKADQFMSAGVRLSYYTSDTISLFLVPSYGRLGISVKVNGMTIDDSSNEFGIGGGISAQIAEDMKAEASYEDFGGTGVLSFGLRYQF